MFQFCSILLLWNFRYLSHSWMWLHMLSFGIWIYLYEMFITVAIKSLFHITGRLYEMFITVAIKSYFLRTFSHHFQKILRVYCCCWQRYSKCCQNLRAHPMLGNELFIVVKEHIFWCCGRSSCGRKNWLRKCYKNI